MQKKNQNQKKIQIENQMMIANRMKTEIQMKIVMEIKIEIEMKKDHPCPYCAKPKVHRVSFGIWQCEKCNAKFTAKAYTVGQKLSLVDMAAQMIAEAPEIRSNTVAEEDEQ